MDAQGIAQELRGILETDCRESTQCYINTSWEAVVPVGTTILDYQEAAVEACLHWTLFAELPKELVG